MIKRVLLGIWLALTPPTAFAIVFPIEPIPINTLDLFGEGALPLGQGAPGEYAFVDSSVAFSLNGPSDVSGQLNIQGDPLSGFTVEVSLTTSLSAQLTLTALDPLGYQGLSSPLVIDLAEPLTSTVTGFVPFSLDLLSGVDDPFEVLRAATTSSVASNTVKHELVDSAGNAVDINGNGEPDFISFALAGFFLDEADVLFDFDPTNPAAGIDITSASLTLFGDVADLSTDPPFILQLNTLSTPVDEPPLLLLFLTALLGVVFARRWSRASAGEVA